MLWSKSNPLLTLPAMLIVGLALSIGWGIRGNYGHEMGAMLPGALASIAVCALSGRDDWRRRLAYFALFGAVGWGFGGSISYMMVIGYTHSGHFIPGHEMDPLGDTVLYGFYSLFFIGFLWAALGGAGTALPAALSLSTLADFVRAFIPVFLVTALLYIDENEILTHEQVTSGISKVWTTLAGNGTAEGAQAGAETAPGIEPEMANRHEDLLYWLDTDWFNVLAIMAALVVDHLIRSRFRSFHWFALLAGLGAAIGVGVHYVLVQSGQLEPLLNAVVHPQGDVTRFPVAQLPINWPEFIPLVADLMGWIVGLTVGIIAYYVLFGRWSDGAGLYFTLALGWFVGFLSLSVLGDLHMTPPRGDSWSGVAGMVVALWIWLALRGWPAPLTASIIAGIVGGIGFSGAAYLKLVWLSNGNPAIVSDPEVINFWKHFQHANWHSVLEQTYGFINGVGLCIALAFIVRRAPDQPDDEPRPRWAEVVAVLFAVPVLTYINMSKNLNDWTKSIGPADGPTLQAIPDKMTAPLLDMIQLSAWGWFTLLFAAVTLAFLLILVVGGWRPLPILPENWLGRSQLLFCMILWVFVVGNFTKALVGFHEQRLITEGLITINAALVTLLLIVVCSTQQTVPIKAHPQWIGVILLSLIGLAAIAVFVPIGETKGIRQIYGTTPAGHAGKNIRFGDEANWRVSPNLKGTAHR